MHWRSKLGEMITSSVMDRQRVSEWLKWREGECEEERGERVSERERGSERGRER